MRALLLFVVVIAAACAPVSGPVSVEALVRDADDPDGYRLETVTLSSVTDLFGGKGELFDVRAGEGFYASPTLDERELDGWSAEDMWQASRAGGDDVRPDLYFDGERWVARDFDSLHYLTVFHNLEEAFAFLREELDRPSGATDAHAHVGLHGVPVSSKALPVPIVLGDNAAYSPGADMFLVVPVINQTSGVPPFMDVGVATHEFHHRVFFHRVMVRDDVFPLWKRLSFPQIYKQEELNAAGSDALTDAASILYSPEELRTFNELRGLDEGLADAFAAGKTGDPDLLRAFAPEQSPMRSLEGELAQSGTFGALEDGTLPDGFNGPCAVDDDGDNFAVLGMNFYCLGTLVAASLWDAADADVVVFRAEVLPAVELALDDLGDVIVERSPAGGTLVFSTEMALEVMAARLPPALAATFCSALAVRFARLLDEGGVPTCG